MIRHLSCPLAALALSALLTAPGMVPADGKKPPPRSPCVGTLREVRADMNLFFFDCPDYWPCEPYNGRITVILDKKVSSLRVLQDKLNRNQLQQDKVTVYWKTLTNKGGGTLFVTKVEATSR
jgi:hypothetical protein